jgi:hypothetical protein
MQNEREPVHSLAASTTAAGRASETKPLAEELPKMMLIRLDETTREFGDVRLLQVAR